MPDNGNPPESLLKKKCQCGEQLKFFAYSATHLVPEWFAQGLALRALSDELLPLMPDIATTKGILLMNFTAFCDECGSVTHWLLDKEELEFITTEHGKELGYGTMWIYNPEFLEGSYAKYPKGVITPMVKIAELAESFRKGNVDDES